MPCLTTGLLPAWCEDQGLDQRTRGVVSLLRSAMTTDPGWQRFATQMDASPAQGAKVRLLRLLVTHAITMQPVQRTALVASGLPWTWERMEHEGLCSLITESKA